MNEQQEEIFVYGRDLVFLSMGEKEAFESGTIAMRIKERKKQSASSSPESALSIDFSRHFSLSKRCMHACLICESSAWEIKKGEQNSSCELVP